jgi:hypothetical protein
MTTAQKIAALKQIAKRADAAVKALDVELASIILVVDDLTRAIAEVDRVLHETED